MRRAEPGQLARQLMLVFLYERFAHLLTGGLQKRISHAAANDERVHFLHQVANHADFVTDLGASQDRYEGPLRPLHGLAQVFELLFHQEARDFCPNKMRNPFRRSMRPVGSAKRIVHINVAQ